MSAPYVLVVNAGWSALKYSLVDGETGDAPATGSVERIGEATGRLKHATASGEHTDKRPFPTFEDALDAAVDAFEDYGPAQGEYDVVAVGHRVVHGGERFSAPTLIDDEVVAAVEELIPLAPLHNPANLEGIRVARKLFPDVPHVAVFDTAFRVGERSPEVRAAVLEGLSRLGIELDPSRNQGPISGPTVVSTDDSEVAVLVVPTNEEYEIARQALQVIAA